MSSEQALEMIQQALLLALILVTPILIAVVVTSLITSMLQTIMHLQDPALSFVPRMIVVVVVVLLTLPWGAQRLIEYSHEIYRSIAVGSS